MSEEMKDAFERIVVNASLSIGSGDHELMNPENYHKDLMQHIYDVGVVRQALKAQNTITRGSGDVFKDMGITQESISVATEALFDSVQTVDDNADLHRIIKTLEETNLYLHKRLEGVRDTCKIAEMQKTIDDQAWLISCLLAERK